MSGKSVRSSKRMCCSSAGELAHRSRGHIAPGEVGLERACERVELLMLEQRLDEQSGGGVVGADEQRKQPLLLVSEVPARLAREELEKGGRGVAPFSRAA